MNQKNTQGPWAVRKVYSNKYLIEKRMEDGLLPTTIAEVYSSPGSGAFNLEQNANLIAASPEMLHALATAQECISWMSDYMDVIEETYRETAFNMYANALAIIRETIQKATS